MSKTIAIAGKGGTGKSTIAALLVQRLCSQDEKPVLAIDADADSNLGTLLGIKEVSSIGNLREDVLEEMKRLPQGMSKAQYVEAGLHNVIYEHDGFDLITMGKGEGSGCYCYLNSLIRKFSESLATSYKWMVIDNEAGLEHISRRTTYHIDALIVVVTDNPLSLDSARNIQEITQRMRDRITKRFIITNMTKKNRLATIKEKIADLHLEYACDIPYDETLDEIIYSGESIVSLGSSPVKDVLDSLITRIKDN
ncbi:AAA family ATPase [Chlamydiota bacterium]